MIQPGRNRPERNRSDLGTEKPGDQFVMGGMRNGTINLEIESRLENVWMVGIAVRNYCLEAGHDYALAVSIELALVEAVNNTIIHAYHSQAGHLVEIRVELSSSDMTFTIKDCGTSMGNLPEMDLQIDSEDVPSLPEGGYGLPIIRQVMDKIEYGSQDNVNTFVMTKVFS